MKKIILNLTECKTLGEIHERIQCAFSFPDWYGKNWDAFWDLLWSECDAECVIIIGEDTLPSYLKEEMKIFYDVLNDKKEFNKKMNFEKFSWERINSEE